MELLEQIWTAAPEWKLRILVILVMANMFLALRSYGMMSAHRMKAAKEGRVSPDTYKATQNEPEDLAVYSRVVANQFEAPVLFYGLVAMSMALGVTSWITVILALAFTILRWRHALEMWGAHVVLRRRAMFIQSFYALILMMVEFFISAMLWV